MKYTYTPARQKHWLGVITARTTAHNQRTEKTERNRQICQLRRDGRTFEEIGANFGISMQAASKIWHRDKRKY